MAKINRITKEVYENIFGYSQGGAAKRLHEVRASLDLTKNDILTVKKFCEYEKITVSEFDEMVERSKKQ